MAAFHLPCVFLAFGVSSHPPARVTRTEAQSERWRGMRCDGVPARLRRQGHPSGRQAAPTCSTTLRCSQDRVVLQSISRSWPSGARRPRACPSVASHAHCRSSRGSAFHDQVTRAMIQHGPVALLVTCALSVAMLGIFDTSCTETSCTETSCTRRSCRRFCISRR